MLVLHKSLDSALQIIIAYFESFVSFYSNFEVYLIVIICVETVVGHNACEMLSKHNLCIMVSWQGCGMDLMPNKGFSRSRHLHGKGCNHWPSRTSLGVSSL